MSRRIEDYALVGDTHTGALIGRDGSVDWLCLPRFDSPACFAALLDTPDAGRWRIGPSDGSDATTRRYLGDSLVLEQVYETSGGSARVVDLMPPKGRDQSDLVRVVEGLSGTVEMTLDLVVRFDYGHIVPWVRRTGGRWSAVAGPDGLWLDTSVELVGADGRTTASFTVEAGQRVPFVLTWSASYLPPPEPVDAQAALDATLDYWSQWISRCSYPDGRYGDAVRRSLITLKALTYAPTGGIAAALTTSLPEQIGGPRNWDYRFCWLRDASFTLQALAGGGYTDEARAWRSWLLRAVAGDPADLQIMYSLTGARRLPESTLDWLAGYEGSSPVRIGNAAADQFQLDVYGEVLDGLATARAAGLPTDDDAWQLQCVLTAQLEKVWREPDNSLWEVRGQRQHFVHSKVMAWVGFDRMVKGVEQYGLPGPVDRWRAAREEIHAQVCEHGYDTDRATFTQYYGSSGLDAALLLIPRVGFLPPDDERVIGTVRAVQRELDTDGFMLRYRTDADPAGAHGTVDGLPGAEGAFLVCSFWLADALAQIGATDEARSLYDRLLALRNDVGLLSEEWDPHGRRQLGNTPQAFSHVGLVNTALALERGTDHLSTGP